MGLYIPTNWSDNCELIITDNDSSKSLRQIIGDPYVYNRDILFTGIPISRRKGDVLKIGFVARLFWKQVIYNFQFSITDIEYYLECKEVDECGEESITRDASHHYEEMN